MDDSQDTVANLSFNASIVARSTDISRAADDASPSPIGISEYTTTISPANGTTALPFFTWESTAACTAATLLAIPELPGPPGIPGEQGERGDQGDSVRGDKGDKGDKGDTGDIDLTGPIGPSYFTKQVIILVMAPKTQDL